MGDIVLVSWGNENDRHQSHLCLLVQHKKEVENVTVLFQQYASSIIFTTPTDFDPPI